MLSEAGSPALCPMFCKCLFHYLWRSSSDAAAGLEEVFVAELCSLLAAEESLAPFWA